MNLPDTPFTPKFEELVVCKQLNKIMCSNKGCMLVNLRLETGVAVCSLDLYPVFFLKISSVDCVVILARIECSFKSATLQLHF